MSLRNSIKNFVLTFPGYFGNGMANFLIHAGYLIKASRSFRKGKEKTFSGGYQDRYKVYDFTVKNEKIENEKIIYLEFGVFKGESIFYWLRLNKNPESIFAGFDTFDGLPEDWGSVKKGAFTNNGNIPVTDDKRCIFLKGLFADTLPGFNIAQFTNCKKIIHLDADLYSSTLYVLAEAAHFLKKDDILIFDDYYSPTKVDHEYKALDDFIKAYPLSLQAVCKTNTQIAYKIV